MGAAVTFAFCMCLIVTSNIEERNIHEPVADTGVRVQKQSAKAENINVTAGVSKELFQYSFTTESDEKIIITKNEPDMVATSSTEEVEEQIEEQIDYENRWGISLTEEEIDLLAKIVWLEACGESQLGQEAVVEVVFNRMASTKYPNNLYDVLSQKNPTQFCSWKNRSIANPTDMEYQSIYEVLNGNTNILRNDTLYFSTVALTNNLDKRIGGHSFCY